MDLLVQRQLDTLSSGNGAYLEAFLRQADKAGFQTRIVFAPWHSFGNRPWSGFHPRFAALAQQVQWSNSIKVFDTYWSLSAKVWGRFIIRTAKEVARRLGFSVYVESYLGKPLSDKEAKLVARQCNRQAADVTIAEYSSMGPVLAHIDTPTRCGVLMHDLLSDRGPRFREFNLVPDFVEISREQEAQWVSKADLLVYASANDRASLQPLVESCSAVWLRPEPPHYNVKNTDAEPSRVVFLGTRHAGNRDALVHLLDDIWPTVRRYKPGLELWVVGSVAQMLDAEHARRPGVKLLGRVEQLEEIGGAASIAVAPTRVATGISIKVAEYLMLGMPCVVYPAATNGFGNVLDSLVTKAISAEEFADAILRLANDRPLCERLSQRSLSEAPKLLSNDEVVNALKAMTVDEVDIG